MKLHTVNSWVWNIRGSVFNPKCMGKLCDVAPGVGLSWDYIWCLKIVTKTEASWSLLPCLLKHDLPSYSPDIILSKEINNNNLKKIQTGLWEQHETLGSLIFFRPQYSLKVMGQMWRIINNGEHQNLRERTHKWAHVICNNDNLQTPQTICLGSLDCPFII